MTEGEIEPVTELATEYATRWKSTYERDPQAAVLVMN